MGILFYLYLVQAQYQLLAINEIVFYLLHLLCTFDEFFQKQFHVIYQYYQLCSSDNNFFRYFNQTNYLLFIYSTLQTLQKFHYNDYLHFLFKMTQIVQYKHFSQYITQIFMIYLNYTNHHSEQTYINTFKGLKQHGKKLNKTYPNIVIVYNAIFKRVQKPLQKQKIAACILKLIDQMEICCAKETLTTLIMYQIRKVKDDPSKQRTLKYLMKRLILTAINFLGPSEIRQKQKILQKGHQAKLLLQTKLKKINRYPCKDGFFKIKIKQLLKTPNSANLTSK